MELLLSILKEISADGVLDDEEINSLYDFLRNYDSEDPKVNYLRVLISEALEDGVITEDERREVIRVVLKLYPPEEREKLFSSPQILPNSVKGFYLLSNGKRFGPIDWKFVRKWSYLEFIPKNTVLATEVDGKLTEINIVDDPRLTRITADLQNQKNSKLTDEQRIDSCLVSDEQFQLLGKLEWPFEIRRSENYYWVHRLLLDIERQFNEGIVDERYPFRDPDSPQSRSTYSEDRSGPATEAQLRYLEDLGVNFKFGITKREASKLIDEALNSSLSVSNRQMMVLRFFGKVDLAKKGRHAVSEWLDEWYSEDPSRKTAWDYWKEKNGDVGKQVDPTWVPIDAFHLSSKDARNRGSVAKHSQKSKVIFAVLIFIVFLSVLGKCSVVEKTANHDLSSREKNVDVLSSQKNHSNSRSLQRYLEVSEPEVVVRNGNLVLSGKIVNLTGKLVRGATLRVIWQDKFKNEVLHEDLRVNENKLFYPNDVWNFQVTTEDDPVIKHFETVVIRESSDF